MKKIQNRFLISFLVLTIIPMFIIGIYSYNIINRILNDKLSASVLSNVNQMGVTLDWRLDRINKCIKYVKADKNIHRLLLEENFNPYKGNIYPMAQSLRNYFTFLLYDQNYIRNAILFSAKGGNYCDKGNISATYEGWIQNQRWYTEIAEGKGSIVWPGEIVDPTQLINAAKVQVAGGVVLDLYFRQSMKPIGIFAILLNPQFFTDFLQNAEAYPLGTYMIMDDKARVIAQTGDVLKRELSEYDFFAEITSNDSGLFYCTIDGMSKVVVHSKPTGMKWKVAQIFSSDYLVRERNAINYLILILLGFCLAGVYILSYLVAKGLAKPIRRIAQAMEKVGKRDFDVSVPVESRDEIGQINQGFNLMVTSIKELFHLAVKEESDKKEAEIRALRYQINPHFLHNTLNSIRMIAIQQNDDQVAEMLLVLSRLLKNTINKNDVLVYLSDELSNIRDYIFMQQIRYNHGIQVSFNVAESILSHKIPPMLLQPIVENAISHGLSDKLNKGLDALLQIAAFLSEGYLCIEIHDNGTGMTQEQIEAVFFRQMDEELHHIGIKNIHERIILQFGTQYGVAVKSAPGAYTRVTVRMPVIETDRDGNP